MTEELNKPAASAALATGTPAAVAMPEDSPQQKAKGTYLAWVDADTDKRPPAKEFFGDLRSKYVLPEEIVRSWIVQLFMEWRSRGNLRVPPFQSQFAAKHGVSEQTLSGWNNEIPERYLLLIRNKRLVKLLDKVIGIDAVMVKQAEEGNQGAAKIIYGELKELSSQPQAAVTSATQVNVNVNGPAQIGVEHWEALPARRPAGEFYEGEVVDDPPAEKAEDLA